MRRWGSVSAGLAKIRRLESERHVLGLVALLDSDERGLTRYSIIRGHAAAALGRLGDERAIPHLAQLSKDPEPIVRSDALAALGRLQATDVREVLLEGLHDPAPTVRMAAAEALGRVGDEAAVPRLRLVVDTDPNPEVRLHAAESLAVLGDPDVAARIPDVVGAVSWRVRRHPRWRPLREFCETDGPLQP